MSRKVKLKQGVMLKQESMKLQQKLSMLRSQVTQKKKQKVMNQTSTSSFRSTVKTQFNNHPNNSSQKLPQQNKLFQTKRMDSALLQKLSQIKLQSLQGKLIQKGVTTVSKLLGVAQQQIDQWKDIAVGWRIKLKKLIKTLSSNHILTTTTTTQQQNLLQQNLLPPPPQLTHSANNIEQIISKRNQIKIFVPLSRQYDQEEQNYDFDNSNIDNGLVTGEEEQQMLIDKLMKVLQPRKPILVKQSHLISSYQHLNKEEYAKSDPHLINNEVKAISWSKSVEQLQRQFLQKSHKAYPKQAIVKEALIDMHDRQKSVSVQKQGSAYDSRINRVNNVTKYCWKCFKRITPNNSNSTLSSGDTKFFCTPQCLQLYNSQTAHFSQSSLCAYENQNQ